MMKKDFLVLEKLPPHGSQRQETYVMEVQPYDTMESAEQIEKHKISNKKRADKTHNNNCISKGQRANY